MIPAIPDIFSDIVDRVTELYGSTVYFYYGNPVEINNRLKVKSNSRTRKTSYPAIFLLLDLEENRNISGRWATINPTLVIVSSTKKTYYAEQRLENNFKPILYPIYEYLLQAISESRYFNNEFHEHVKHDHYFYGSDMFDGKSSFDQIFDAIELNFSNLLVIKTC